MVLSDRNPLSSIGDDTEGAPTHIHQNVALAIAGSSMFTKESDYDVIQGVSTQLTEFLYQTSVLFSS